MPSAVGSKGPDDRTNEPSAGSGAGTELLSLACTSNIVLGIETESAGWEAAAVSYCVSGEPN